MIDFTKIGKDSFSWFCINVTYQHDIIIFRWKQIKKFCRFCSTVLILKTFWGHMRRKRLTFFFLKLISTKNWSIVNFVNIKLWWCRARDLFELRIRLNTGVFKLWISCIRSSYLIIRPWGVICKANSEYPNSLPYGRSGWSMLKYFNFEPSFQLWWCRAGNSFESTIYVALTGLELRISCKRSSYLSY